MAGIHVSNPGFNRSRALDDCTPEGGNVEVQRLHDEGPSSFVKHHVSQKNKNEKEVQRRDTRAFGVAMSGRC